MSCVPIATIWKIGATRKPRKTVYVKKPPSVSVPARIWRVPDEHDDRAHDPEEDRGGEAHDARRGQRLQDVVEEALHAGRERLLLALLGVVALHDADAAERLGEAARDLGVDLRALAEDRPDRPERLVQDDAEADEEREAP